MSELKPLDELTDAELAERITAFKPLGLSLSGEIAKRLTRRAPDPAVERLKEGAKLMLTAITLDEKEEALGALEAALAALEERRG